MKNLFLALIATNLLVGINSAAIALPGDKTQRMQQILKHHAFFPSSGFGQNIGEVGPIWNARILTDHRYLLFEAYYNVHLDHAETI